MPVARLLEFDRINHWMTWLRSMGARDADLGYGNLLSISQSGIPDDVMESMILQMERELIKISDVDRAINNFERFVQATRSPLSLGTLLQRDLTALPILLQLFSASQYCSDLLVLQPEYFDHLRLTGGQPVAAEDLKGDLCSEVAGLSDPVVAGRIIRRFKHREMLRIAYGDIVLGLPLETITSQISYLADAACQAAYEFQWRSWTQKWGVPLSRDGQPVAFSILALGKLGGTELNYSSDIDLILLYAHEGKTAQNKTNREFFDALGRSIVKMLSENSELGMVYRVDMRLRPDGSSGQLTHCVPALIDYYENRGRTWERQAFLKARPIAGDLALGSQFLRSIEHWIYPKYLSQFQIEGIAAIKRQIEKRSLRDGDDFTNVKTGHGGIRDVEFAIQFLQLLHAADRPEIRTGNTLEAISKLRQAECLSLEEEHLLQKNYRFLRMVEHRLQLMFDLQTHQLPKDDWELRKLAIRCGCKGDTRQNVLEGFLQELKSVRHANRRILNHLLHDAFSEGGADFKAVTRSVKSSVASESPGAWDEFDRFSEVDLILDPSPDPETIEGVLTSYGFQKPNQAYCRLLELSREKSRFLSDQRCRHFFAAICRSLLQAVSSTPSPDQTLTQLSLVADSLGNKGVLWELFSDHQPSMQLCIRLCASTSYLTSILTGNPGMLDQLMDSLLLDQLPTRAMLQQNLSELLRGAEDAVPILHNFKNAMHLLVGVRDILGKEPLQATHEVLSDIADVCLEQIVEFHYTWLVRQMGQPVDRDTKQAMGMATVAMGKLGGREPNYHSDLDLIFVYPEDGTTVAVQGQAATSHQHFFSQLGTLVIKTLSQFGSQGRLYEVDCRLRPSGKSGSLAVSLAAFDSYFRTGGGQLWERQALCKSRILNGCQVRFAETLTGTIRQIVLATPAPAKIAKELYQMRQRVEHGAAALNLKRGAGGTVDIEFAIQLLQLIHGKQFPLVFQPGTLQAIQALAEVGVLSKSDSVYFTQAYQFLRGIESRLRLQNTTARHDFPEELSALEQLAYLLRVPSADTLVETLGYFRTENRQRWRSLVSQFTNLPD